MMPPMMPPGYYTGNRAERDFAIWADGQGWAVTKRGWPDFICQRGDEVMCVEVKESTGLSGYQRRTAVILGAHGLPTYVWWSQTRKLEPLSEVTRLLTDEEMTAARAIEYLGEDLARARGRTGQAERELGKLSARLEALRAERKAEREETERLMDDFGYLLRQAQDHQRHGYTCRMKAIIRRHPDLAWPELPAAPARANPGATRA